MKKFLVFGIAAALSVPAAVSAAELSKPAIDPETGIVTIAGNLGESSAFHRVTLFVEDADGENAGAMNWFDTVKCDANGDYSFSYKMSGDNGGMYTAKVYVENSSQSYSSPFQFFDAATESQALWNKITDGRAAKDTSVISEIIETRDDYLGLDLTKYTELSDESKTQVCTNIYDLLTSISDFKPALSDLSDVWTLNELTETDKEQFIEGLSELKGSGLSEADNVFKELGEEEQNALYAEMIATDYANKEAMLTAYQDGAILAGVNSASGWGELYTVLETAQNTLGISFDDYNKLKDKITPISEMLKTYTKLTDITTAFNEAVAEQAKAEKKSTSNSSSGGGSSSGNSLGTPTIIPAQNADSIAANSYTFSDIADVEWAVGSIEMLKSRGIAAGEDGKYYPHRNVTRAEFVKMLMCTFPFQKTDEERVFAFDDVNEGEWYYAYVRDAFEKGIINGVDETSFSPKSEMTRQDMAVVLYNALKAKMQVEDAEADFSDNSEISDYAKTAVGALGNYGIINALKMALSNRKKMLQEHRLQSCLRI